MSIFRVGRRRWAESLGIGLLAVGTLVVAAGCEGKSVETAMDQAVQDLFQPRRTPEQYMIVAVSSEDADLRRDAVSRIARSSDASQEWAIKGFYAIACLENDPQTRCVAIRALGRTGDPRATEAALRILNHEVYPPEEVVPPTPLVRWDAAVILADLSERGQIPAESADEVRATLIERLRLDSERHTRIAAARGLGCYPHADTLASLIEGLRDQEFTVAHACETSLIKHTGTTHNLDPIAWETWLAEQGESAFANAGEIPESRQMPYRNPVEKMVYDTNDLIEYLWPGPAK